MLEKWELTRNDVDDSPSNKSSIVLAIKGPNNWHALMCADSLEQIIIHRAEQFYKKLPKFDIVTGISSSITM
jgi:hypothetical protein